MKNLMLLVFIFASLMTHAQTLSGDDILKKIDANRRSDNKIIVSKMIIHGRRGSRTIEAKSWQKNLNETFTEYLSPPREKGIKMLKLKDQLWTYSPSTDRTIMISGHMLRQSVMGSDLSYEDMMEDPLLQNMYSVEITGKDTLNSRVCYVLDLTAKNENVAYASRKIWVDVERFLTLKEDLFAKSGKLLKTASIEEVMFVENRWTAKRVLYKDVLKEGDGTEFEIISIDYDADIPAYKLSKAALRK